MDLKKKLQPLILETIKWMGFGLWGIEFFPQRSLLRVYIDKSEGVTVDDCAAVSRQVGTLLDVENLINRAYTLQVSSPGLDRPLLCKDHWQASTGNQLKVEMFAPHNGRRKFRGTLLRLEEDNAVLQERPTEVLHLPIHQVKRANIVPDFGG